MFTTKLYSVTLSHNETVSTSHTFNFIEALDIFVNMIEAEAFVPFYGLQSFYNLEQEINQVFTEHPYSFPEWQWVLNVCDYDYMSAWQQFNDRLEDDSDDQAYESYQEKINEQYASCLEF